MDKVKNAEMLTNELNWLSLVIDFRLNSFFVNETNFSSLAEIEPPTLIQESDYAQMVSKFNMNLQERLILILTLAPYLKPQILDLFFLKNINLDRVYTEFGGIKGQSFSGFIPTGETVAFILAGNDLKDRLETWNYFREEHFFKTQNIISLAINHPDEPFFAGVLKISDEYLHLLTKGITQKINYSTQFPATKISTNLNWEDLVLDNSTLEDVEEIKDWIKFKNKLLNDWEMSKIIKPGYLVLFYGISGTGKSLTAALIGKSVGMDVYRVDLSMIVSKYIGETEKNLGNIFNQATNKNWILFFDDADALFGKRTEMSSSNDRYVNQEISYLLQRIEDFPGVVILASNLRVNLDEAHSRRFQLMINFAMPHPEQREKLWLQSFSNKTTFEPAINIKEIAQKYELTGGSIINISRYCSLKAIKRNEPVILLKDLIQGIRKEFIKNGKVVNY